MDILKTIHSADGKMVGVYLDSSEGAFGIALEALHTKAILDALIKSGWSLESLPYGFVRSGKGLDQLPQMSYSELDAVSQRDFDMYDSVLTNSQLSAYLPAVPTRVIPLREPIFHLIRTRESLIRYLKSECWKAFDVDHPETYLPINAFTDPSALFSINEFLAPENAEFVRAIDGKRKMCFEAYREMVCTFLPLGLKENFTSIDLQEFYFSWGIEGIYDSCIGIDNSVRLECPIIQGNSSASGFVEVSTDALIDAYGNVMPPVRPGWSVHNKPDFTTMADTDTRVVRVSQAVMIPAVLMTFSGFSAMFDKSTLVLRIKDSMIQHYMSTCQPKVPFSFSALPYADFNFVAKERWADIVDLLFCDSLAKDFVHRLAVHTDVSSLKAIQAVGATEPNAMKFIATKLSEMNPMTDEGTQDTEEIGRLNSIASGIVSYLEGNDNPEDDPMSMFTGVGLPPDFDRVAELEEFIQNVRDGNVNIDNTQQGYELDSHGNLSEYSHAFLLALRAFELTRQELYDQVMKAPVPQDHTGELVLHSHTGLTYKIPVFRGDAMVCEYKRDLEQYPCDAADTAKLWINVTAAFTEPSHTGRFRHVAITYQAFNHCNKNNRSYKIRFPQIETYFTTIVQEECISRIPDPAMRESAIRKLSRYVCHLVFAAYNSNDGTVTLPKSLGGGVIDVDPDILRQLKSGSMVTTHIESLFGICDSVCDGGRFYIYCNNARLNPDLVIPFTGTMIPEYPFLPNWFDTSNRPADRQNFAKRGVLIRPDFTGFQRDYPITCGLPHTESMPTNGVFRSEAAAFAESSTSLVKYYNTCVSFRNAAKRDRTYQLSYIPTLAEQAYPRCYTDEEEERIESCTPETFVDSFTQSRPRLITSKILKQEWPEIVSAVEYKEIKDNLVNPDSFAFNADLPSVLINEIGDEGVQKLNFHLASSIPVYTVVGDWIVFRDMKKVKWRDINSLDFDIYAASHVGRYVILMDVQHRIIMREIKG